MSFKVRKKKKDKASFHVKLTAVGKFGIIFPSEKSCTT